MTNPRKPGVVLRFCEYELEELNRLAKISGDLPRSSIVNIALEHFLRSPTEADFLKCRKRKVNMIIGPDLLKKLTEKAENHKVHRTDLIRLAIHNFKQKYDPQDTSPRKP